MNLSIIQTKEQVSKLVDICGLKRFKKILSIYIKTKDITPSKLEYNYFKISYDSFERIVFSDRLMNKGFMRNDPQNIKSFMKHCIDILDNAKINGLI